VRHPADAAIETIASRLRARQPRLHQEPLSAEVVPARASPVLHASVALVVRPGRQATELLLIKRASFPGDPWSGHIAFPGGRRAPDDRSPRDTAIRETREEVGLELEPARFLGRLDDVAPRPGAPNVSISPFVFSVGTSAELRLNHEVALALWVPIDHLADPASATDYLHELAGGTALRFPAIRLDEHVIWGLTYRIIAQFLDLARTGPEQGGSRG
jgi:8-oxo-dGTP pyrophosphatase MutT (NUDIX family)